jgi:hypothetical protein
MLGPWKDPREVQMMSLSERPEQLASASPTADVAVSNLYSEAYSNIGSTERTAAHAKVFAANDTTIAGKNGGAQSVSSTLAKPLVADQPLTPAETAKLLATQWRL